MKKVFHYFNSGVDCTLPFNNSVDFILQNFGSFSPLAQLQDFSSFSRHFSAVSQKWFLSLDIKDFLKNALWMHVNEVSCHWQVDALPVLTLEQLGELVFSPPVGPENRGNILSRVFHFLLEAPNRDKLNNFLPSLQTQARKVFDTTLHVTCVEIHLTTLLLLLLCFNRILFQLFEIKLRFYYYYEPSTEGYNRNVWHKVVKFGTKTENSANINHRKCGACNSISLAPPSVRAT